MCSHVYGLSTRDFCSLTKVKSADRLPIKIGWTWQKALWILAFRHFAGCWSLASGVDGGFIEATAASVGWIFIRRLSAQAAVRGVFGAPDVVIVRLDRRSKKRFAGAVAGAEGWYDRRLRQVRDLPSAGFRVVLELEVRRVDCRRCGSVKRERLDFLADNAHFTKRFAYYVGRRCQQASIRDVARDLKLDWDTVKTLEQQYMRAQLESACTPAPQAIGIDEIAVRKGHSYRIVVSDLVRKRPIWFGGTDRSEASMAAFYNWLGRKKSRKIRLAVMDMWRPFRTVAQARVPQAAILFDKFHVMRHLARRSMPCARANMPGSPARTAVTSRARSTRCSRAGITYAEGRQALKTLLRANKRLNTAYLLKLLRTVVGLPTRGFARRFFENWRAALKWQRLQPYRSSPT